MEHNLFGGIHAVLYALFQGDEALDHGAMAAQVEYCLDAGCHGIAVLGLATEVLKLTPEERRALVETVGAAISGRRPLAVTISGNSVAEQVSLAHVAKDNGADWLVLQPPMAGTYGAEVYLDFFERVAGAVDLPVAIQNAPQYLGRGLSAGDIQRLRDRCPNFVCIKSEDAALSVQHIIETCGDSISVLGGRGGLEMTDLLRAGCKGFVLAPDIAPVAVRILDLWQADDQAGADRLYGEAAPAIGFAMQSLEHLVTYGKRMFAANAGLTVHDRAPCLEPTAFGLGLQQRWADELRRLVRI